MHAVLLNQYAGQVLKLPQGFACWLFQQPTDCCRWSQCWQTAPRSATYCMPSHSNCCPQFLFIFFLPFFLTFHNFFILSFVLTFISFLSHFPIYFRPFLFLSIIFLLNYLFLFYSLLYLLCAFTFSIPLMPSNVTGIIIHFSRNLSLHRKPKGHRRIKMSYKYNSHKLQL
jgi:hypothetical protein